MYSTTFGSSRGHPPFFFTKSTFSDDFRGYLEFNIINYYINFIPQMKKKIENKKLRRTNYEKRNKS